MRPEVKLRTLSMAAASVLAIVAGSQPAHAQAQASATAEAAITRFNIPAQPLQSALMEFGRQAGVTVVAPNNVLRGKQSAAVLGDMTAEAALAQLLSGTDLRMQRTAEGSLTVVASTASPTQLGDAGDAASSEEIVVTGTRIPNVHDQFAPVTQLGRNQMDLAGNATVADALAGLSQNFGGGVTPDTSPALSTTGAGAAGVNLRGLGNEATLVLLNGRRMSQGGAFANFVDISSIPTSAIDRVEVLTDGASAIYGADAIAGVVNIIMRQDFNGAETRVGYSAATQGGAPSLTVGQTLGWANDRAHALVTLEYDNDAALLARDKDFSRGVFPDSQALTPSSERSSVFASGGLHLTDAVTLSADAYYDRRSSSADQAVFIGAFTPITQSVEMQQYGASAGLNWQLPHDWEADVTGAFSRSKLDAIGSQDLTPIGGDLVVQVDAPTGDIASFDASVGGPLFAITREPVRAVFGVHARTEEVRLDSFNPPTSSPFDIIVNKSRDVRSVFGEIYAPIVSEEDHVAGVNRLALTAAVRYDDYSDFGATTNPRYGIVWSPVADLTFRGTYGTAFRAPSLYQSRDFYSSFGGIYVDPDAPSGESVALFLFGQKQGLQPETADVWTAGFDFRPQALSPLSLRLTYFNIDYDNRIGTPTYGFNSDLQFTDFTGALVRTPSPQLVADYIAHSITFTDAAAFNPALPAFDPNNVAVILDQRMQNLASSRVNGVDIDLSYGLTHNDAAWTFSITGTLLTTYAQQAAPSAPQTDLLNTFGNPVDLRWRAQIQRVAGPITASVFLNYIGDYRDTASTNPDYVIGDWITWDASLRFDFGAMLGGAAQNTTLTLTARNILDAPPPRIGPHPSNLAQYDAANADPAGRRLGVLLTKRW